MHADDLTRLKYVGPARMRTLNAHGITTVSQLIEIPFETLSHIKGIGAFYGKRIKDAAMEIGRPIRSDRGAKGKQEDEKPRCSAMRKQLDKIRENLMRLDSPPPFGGPAQALTRFAEYKTVSGGLLRCMAALLRDCEELPAIPQRKIIRKARKLKKELKNAASITDKKTLKRISHKLASFSAFLRKQPLAESAFPTAGDFEPALTDDQAGIPL